MVDERDLFGWNQINFCSFNGSNLRKILEILLVVYLTLTLFYVC